MSERPDHPLFGVYEEHELPGQEEQPAQAPPPAPTLTFQDGGLKQGLSAHRMRGAAPLVVVLVVVAILVYKSLAGGGGASRSSLPAVGVRSSLPVTRAQPPAQPHRHRDHHRPAPFAIGAGDAVGAPPPTPSAVAELPVEGGGPQEFDFER